MSGPADIGPSICDAPDLTWHGEILYNFKIIEIWSWPSKRVQRGVKMTAAPQYDIDFYSDDFIRNPWPHYAKMRELGPVVYLPRLGNFALTRHAEVSGALRDHDTFISGLGVGADEEINKITRGNSAASDGDRHTAIRTATSAPLLPGALEKIRAQVEIAADQLIEDLAERASFEVMKDLAQHLPLTIVRDLVGLPEAGRENMLRWANATFDLLGAQNERGRKAKEAFLEQRKYAQSQADTSSLNPGSWTRRLWDLVEDGLLDPELAPVAMRDYLNPSLDTTISATGQLIYQLGKNPDQWAKLRQHPELARNAANEAVRMASPVRSFSRHTSKDVTISGVDIPKGANVMMVYASANRDDRVFENPDQFDITREIRHHVGFGSGIHMCVGMHLAQLEMIALLDAMIPRVNEIKVGEPDVALNNTIHSFATLDATFVAETGHVWLSEKPREDPAPSSTETTLAGRITRRSIVGDNIIHLVIEPAAGVVFPEWEPGAHIDLHLRGDLIRQYTLMGEPGSGGYEIAVQLEPESRGGSRTIFRLQEGADVTISAPRNHFRLDESARSIVLFSGGIGMTPLLAMARRLHALGKDFSWHISVRSKDRLPMADLLERLAFKDKIQVHLDDGEPGQQLNASAILMSLPDGAHLYVCGPFGYMTYLTKLANESGLDESRVHLEHFGAEIDVDGDPFTVVARRSGKTMEVGPNETILEVLTREGFEIATSCKNGVCGTCVTGVLEGKPDHRDFVLTSEEKARNDRVAACCSRSQTPLLVLDL